MKRYLPLIVTLCLFSKAQAQDAPIEQTNHHEIGVDATPFLTQLLSNGYYNNSPYNVSYRYHFTNWALRAGIGGTMSSEEGTTNDTISQHYKTSYITYRVGVEHKSNFMKRWQAFYGLDIKSSINIYNTKSEYSTTYIYTQENKETRYGIAPFLGFRFKINSRISVITETSYLFYFGSGTFKRTVVPSNNYNQVGDFKSSGTEFTLPSSIIFTYNF